MLITMILMSKCLHVSAVFYIYLVDICLSLQQSKRFQALIKPEQSGRFQLTGAVQTDYVSSKIGCFAICILNNHCVTFFYNDFTKHCLLHLKDFKYTSTQSGIGWTHYVINDGDGRCPIGALLYRPLDFCYTLNTIRRARYGIIKQDCKNKGASLAAVESQQKQSYFELFLAERPCSRICIAGEEKVYNIWTLDDGTPLTYFNWYYIEPDHLDQKCLEIYINDEWFDIQCINNDPCVYVCEIKSI